ncbi:Uncharacterized protein PECH_004495 [Penicillium ucsense]|uniref:Nuclear pore assembly and biogenesis-domain-containing protein n=1 Tax=Penicillium ucsense TaxID=2839758 RepID=A0A8J8W319_9EURO|nr:Uncharacterized protein PECM_004800 [Penicillium ucsense]KAF7737006.1 Uncharacterized protein PECH_004495 [Penicillium ucsense]
MDHLPEPLQAVLTNATYTYLRSSAHSQLTTHLSTFREAIIDPYILDPLSQFLAATLGLSSMPDLMTSVMLVGLLLVSLVILDYVRRLVIWWVMWWVRFIVRVAFWGLVVFAGFYVYNFGVDKTVQDAGRLVGFAMGFAEQVWNMVESASANRNGHGNGNQKGSWNRGASGSGWNSNGGASGGRWW